MGTFKVKIRDIYEKEIEIEAETEEEALELTKDRYYEEDEEIMLDAGDFYDNEFTIVK